MSEKKINLLLLFFFFFPFSPELHISPFYEYSSTKKARSLSSALLLCEIAFLASEVISA